MGQDAICKCLCNKTDQEKILFSLEPADVITIFDFSSGS